MPLLLLLGGSGLFLSAGYFAGNAGNAAEKTGNAGLKILGASAVVMSLYLYSKRK
jgi:hypothetical protein